MDSKSEHQGAQRRLGAVGVRSEVWRQKLKISERIMKRAKLQSRSDLREN